MGRGKRPKRAIQFLGFPFPVLSLSGVEENLQRLDVRREGVSRGGSEREIEQDEQTKHAKARRRATISILY